MKYRVGDRVRIRDWEDMAEEHGINGSGGISPLKGAAIALKMKEFCGEETTIIDKMTQGNYRLETDHGKWLWPECALLPILKYVPPKKPIAYISGPITGAAIPLMEFSKAKVTLTENGYDAINPAKLNSVLHQEAGYEDYMDICLVLVEKSDILVLLPGWERSPGANREMGYAKGLGKKVMTLEEACKTTNTDSTPS